MNSPENNQNMARLRDQFGVGNKQAGGMSLGEGDILKIDEMVSQVNTLDRRAKLAMYLAIAEVYLTAIVASSVEAFKDLMGDKEGVLSPLTIGILVLGGSSVGVTSIVSIGNGIAANYLEKTIPQQK